MAEIAVSFVLEQLFPLLKEKASLFMGVHKEFVEIQRELQSIEAFLKDADRRAEEQSSDGIQTWVKQLREAAFRIEDVIDEYMIFVAQRPRRPGYLAILQKVCHLLKNSKSRHQIASEIAEIKSSLVEIKERSERYNFLSSLEQGSSNSGGTQNVEWRDPRLASLFIQEAEVVGFEGPRDKLINWLVDGSATRSVISVVGMGGLGKTTLAKKVFDNQKVAAHFDCRAFVTVSQSYSVEGLIREMMEQLCKSRREPIPEGMNTTNKVSLVTEVMRYLQQKRYVVIFDDVWKQYFWDEIQLFVPNNNNGSRVIITTRMVGVAEFCKRSSLVHVHQLQPLTPEKAWELFCKKAFRFDYDGECPKELWDMSIQIVKKCGGLPLAIVTIGGLLSTKAKTIFEWERFCKNLSSELESNLPSLTRILALSYYDLPYHLKSCLLYFGIYPEDYPINCVRLVRQWVAEGFVHYRKGKTLEEVAEEYLTELIHRSLVLVFQVNFDGKARRCGVHDMLREIILIKMEKLNFARFVSEDQSIFDGVTRRLAITTSCSSYELVSSGNSSSIRSLYIFGLEQLSESFVGNISSKHRLLKILDFEDAPLGSYVDNWEDLFHLRYLSLRSTDVQCLPKSIGKLQNLETLDLKQTRIREIPSEINKLTKLRHLLVYYRDPKTVFSLTRESGAQVKGSIRCLASLQKLYHVEVHHGGLELIKELKSLRQLRKLGLKHVKQEYGLTLCASIMEMKHLQSLEISAIAEDEIIDLNSISSPLQLRRLCFKGRLEKLPDWASNLQHLVSLRLFYCMLKDDPLKPFKNLPNLVQLSMGNHAFDGEILHFKEREFQKLEVLSLRFLKKLNSIVIDERALPVLKHFDIGESPQLKKVPLGIHHLEKLETLTFYDMPNEFIQSIDERDGHDHWFIKHVPFVLIGHRQGARPCYTYDTIRHPEVLNKL